jgi:hypothetical protein
VQECRSIARLRRLCRCCPGKKRRGLSFVDDHSTVTFFILTHNTMPLFVTVVRLLAVCFVRDFLGRTKATLWCGVVATIHSFDLWHWLRYNTFYGLSFCLRRRKSSHNSQCQSHLGWKPVADTAFFSRWFRPLDWPHIFRPDRFCPPTQSVVHVAICRRDSSNTTTTR